MMSEPAVVLLVDDDADDCFLMVDAFKRSGVLGEIVCLDDGARLHDYLKRRGLYSGLAAERLPSLILLDLNLPGSDGYEILRDLKADPDLRAIPVVVMTTSRDEGDVLLSYDLGASSFISKPGSYDELQELAGLIGRYWLGAVRLPR